MQNSIADAYTLFKIKMEHLLKQIVVNIIIYDNKIIITCT